MLIFHYLESNHVSWEENISCWSEIWSFLGGEDIDRGLLGCDAVLPWEGYQRSSEALITT